MEVTKSQKILIRWLKAVGLTEDDTVAVMVALDTLEKQDMLAEFLTNNKDATPQDVLKETIRILKMTDDACEKE